LAKSANVLVLTIWRADRHIEAETTSCFQVLFGVTIIGLCTVIAGSAPTYLCSLGFQSGVKITVLTWGHPRVLFKGYLGYNV